MKAIALNFSHPFTPLQWEQLNKHYTFCQAVVEVHIPCQLDTTKPFQPQIDALTAKAWETLGEEENIRIAVNYPALSAAAVLVEQFMADNCASYDLIRIAPVKGTTPPQFEVAEIISLGA